MTKSNKKLTAEQRNQSKLTKEIYKIMDSYKDKNINRFQINKFNMLELENNKTDIQTAHFLVEDQSKTEEDYVCIIIYAGKEQLTYDNITIMFGDTPSKHNYRPLKDRPDTYVDLNGLVVPTYILQGGLLVYTDEEGGRVESF